MKVYSVYDDEFAEYGIVLEHYDFSELFLELEKCSCPDDGTEYEASVAALEGCDIFDELRNRGFGGMPIQIGYVSGRNSRLNCLEYHKSIEFNIARDDIVLMLGKREEIVNGKFDTSNVKAFHVPAGAGVELFDTTLHYAPCGYAGGKYRVACVLPMGTNGAKPESNHKTEEDEMCYGMNKWLMAHPSSAEAQNGAYIGLTGENLQYR
ncbi:MAG: DUF4867 family protein [Acetatifactor sp.]|nr:DUF4867 family protein [Acetatifactor sp.]